jgi:hypothetical protein
MPISPFKKEKKEFIKPPEKEVIPPPEAIPEKKEKLEEIKVEKEVKETPSGISPIAPSEEVTVLPKVEKSPLLIKIEEILSEDLDEIYNSLTAQQKIIFDTKKKETASKIEILIKKIKVNVKKILNLIKELLFTLLKMIPGINKYFLIQQSKIKTQKILSLRETEFFKK